MLEQAKTINDIIVEISGHLREVGNLTDLLKNEIFVRENTINELKLKDQKAK